MTDVFVFCVNMQMLHQIPSSQVDKGDLHNLYCYIFCSNFFVRLNCIRSNHKKKLAQFLQIKMTFKLRRSMDDIQIDQCFFVKQQTILGGIFFSSIKKRKINTSVHNWPYFLIDRLIWFNIYNRHPSDKIKLEVKKKN